MLTKAAVSPVSLIRAFMPSFSSAAWKKISLTMNQLLYGVLLCSLDAAAVPGREVAFFFVAFCN